MRALRILIASLLIALSLLAAPVCATSYSTDQSDLWYNPSESGWGIQLVQRGNVIFFTMFVYDGANKPVWYVGTIYTQGGYVWTGDMYLTTGPWFGATFNPTLFGGRIVGSMTWTGITVETATLNYSVDGVAVTKNVTRQTLVNDDFSGRYAGSIHETFTGCTDPVNNRVTETPGTLTIAQSGNLITLTAKPYAGGSCIYSGSLRQTGQMGSIDVGNYSCTNGLGGYFQVSEMQVNIVGITGQFTDGGSALGCYGRGWFGGVLSTVF